MNPNHKPSISIIIGTLIIAALTTKDIERIKLPTPIFPRHTNDQTTTTLTNTNSILKKLLIENNELKKLLKIKPTFHPRTHIGTITSLSPFEWTNSIQINLGSTDNITPFSIAYKPEGIIGQITYIQKTTSIITLLTDPNTKIPSITENTAIKGITYGNHTHIFFQPTHPTTNIKFNEPILTFIPHNTQLPKIPIGKTIKTIIKTDKTIYQIKPYAQISSNDNTILILPTEQP